MKKLLKKHQNRLKISLFLILLFSGLFAIFFPFIKAVVICTWLILTNIGLRSYRYFLKGFPIELEITIFSTVLVSSFYGFVPGLIVAFLSFALPEIFSLSISPSTLLSLGAYLLIPSLMFFIPGVNLLIGLFVVFFINLVIFVGNIFLGYDPGRNAFYSSSNLVWNYFIFSTFLEIVKGIII